MTRPGKPRLCVTSAASRGTRNSAASSATAPALLAKCLAFDSQLDRLGERLGVYAFLRTAEDQTNSVYQRMLGRYQNAATRAAEAASYIRPELLALPAARLKKLMAHKAMQPYRLLVERLVRFKPHTLGKKEEELLAMQGEMAQAASRTFRQLHDADLKFGFVTNELGEKIELSNATFVAAPALAQALGAPRGVSPVLRAVLRSRKHAGGHAPRLDSQGCLLCASAPVPQLARRGPVSRQRAALGVRQSDRLRSASTCRPCITTMKCVAARCGCAISTSTTRTCRSSASWKRVGPGTRRCRW